MSFFQNIFAQCAMTSLNHQQEKTKTMKQVTTAINDFTKTIYTCPMHPEVISDKSGKCPKCGMDLVRKINTNENKMKMDGMCPLMNMSMNNQKNNTNKKAE